MKKVFISILNFNGKKNTIDCLKSLSEIRKINLDLTVLVVDNASSDGSPSVISNFKSQISNLKFVRNERNLGFSGGHNVGLGVALKNGADYVLILNNDTIIDKFFLEELLKVIELNDRIGIVVPKIYFAKGFEFHKDRYSDNETGKVFWYTGGKIDFANVLGSHRGVDEVDSGQYDKIEQTEIATGCCMLIKKEMLGRVGLFDEKYFLYYEDADLSMRARKNGYQIIYVPSSIVWHKNAGSAGGSGSQLQDYYITRNRMLFGFKYAPMRAKLALIKESFRLLSNGRRWQKRGILDFYLRRFGKGSFNI